MAKSLISELAKGSTSGKIRGAKDLYEDTLYEAPKSTTDDSLEAYNLNSLYKLYGGGGSGGGYSPMKADISGLLSAYDKQAESAKQIAETKYKNTREDLLTSLKRFQEENAQNVQNQKTSYLSEQASMESAREQANRQNRISAAARGIGGSGLQQLAQLQNLIGQSEQISKSAGSNQQAMDKLATLLRNYEEDSDAKIRQNEQERADTLNTIASTLASQRAAAIAQNEQNYVNAVNAARAQAAASRAAASSNAINRANSVSGALNQWQSSLKGELEKARYMSNDELNKTYGTSSYSRVKDIIRNDYLGSLSSLQGDLGFDKSTFDTASRNLNSLLDSNKRIVEVKANNSGYDWLKYVFPVGYGIGSLF